MFSHKIGYESFITILQQVQLWTFLEWGTLVAQITGTLGSQLHIANALTAIYMAMGQDVACVAENSLGNFTADEYSEDTMHISLTLPSLTVGTSWWWE